MNIGLAIDATVCQCAMCYNICQHMSFSWNVYVNCGVGFTYMCHWHVIARPSSYTHNKNELAGMCAREPYYVAGWEKWAFQECCIHVFSSSPPCCLRSLLLPLPTPLLMPNIHDLALTRFLCIACMKWTCEIYVVLAAIAKPSTFSINFAYKNDQKFKSKYVSREIEYTGFGCSPHQFSDDDVKS